MAFRTTKERERDQRKNRLDDLRDEEIWLGKIRKVFGSPEGLDVLDWLLDNTGVLDSVWTGNSNSYYLMGRQDLGQKVLTECMKADPYIFHSLVDRWAKMIELRKAEEYDRLGVSTIERGGE